MKTKFILFALFAAFLLKTPAAKAMELTPQISCDGVEDVSALTEISYYTDVEFKAGDKISVKSSVKISGIYIVWNSEVSPYSMDCDGQTLNCGAYGYIHDYTELPSACDEVVITIPKDAAKICYIRIFSDKVIPDDVQVWNPPCEKADILLVPAHADDEILFLGGIIPTYLSEGARIQVAYMASFWDSAAIREHEKLDGLYYCGLRNYPVCGGFADVYSEDIETAKTQYDTAALTDYAVTVIRRFKPQVVVSHDFNGEYGHGFHRLTALTVSEALTLAADKTYDTDNGSLSSYGIWDTPKAYFHLYSENTLTLNLRLPLADYGEMTALEIAAEAYKKHVSQQWCWFYVSDDYKYSCANFGLYKTLVGTDTTGSMLDNLILYQTREEEESRIQESIRQSSIDESVRESESMSEAASIRESESMSEYLDYTQEQDKKSFAVKSVAIIVSLLALSTIAILTVKKPRKSS